MLKLGLNILLSCALALALCGCTLLENIKVGRMFQSLVAGQTASNPESLSSRVEQLLDQGKSAEALVLLQNGIAAGIDRQRLSNQGVRAINLALVQADHQSSQQQHLQAGKLYRSALTHYPADAAVSHRITRTADEIMARIGECANQLLEDGLVAYRAGSLEEAIDVWSKIRQFHPSYKASQQAIRTTRIQLKNLESVNPAAPANGS